MSSKCLLWEERGDGGGGAAAAEIKREVEKWDLKMNFQRKWKWVESYVW